MLEENGNGNPFKPGTGHQPPLLAGRQEETRLLANTVTLVHGPRAEREERLESDPLPPIKLIGPRGAGKTTLLHWIKREKEQRVRAVTWSKLKDNGPKGTSIADLMFKLAGGEDLLFERIRQVGLSLPGGAGFGVMLDKAERNYERIMAQILAEEPLLLLLDEVHHYDLEPLSTLLQKNQELIADGLPLAMVLAGTPGLDGHLAKASATFIDRCQEIYINTLSDEATRAALYEPFDDKGVTVTAEALEAMAAQTDNYPFFIQWVGWVVWEAMAEAGRTDVDLALVEKVEGRARTRRDSLYDKNYTELDKNGLLAQARQVIELLEGRGGKVDATVLVDALVEANPGIDRERGYEISDGLRDKGLFWTVDGNAVPGIPSFFSYFKARQQREGA